jgi:chromosome partitioning protein
MLPRMTTTLAVTAFKGGAGKTTVTSNLAGALAARGRRVLVVDADPQGAAGDALGADPAKPGLYEVLHRAAPAAAAIRPSAVPGLEVLVCDLDLAAVEQDLTGEADWRGRLREALASVGDRYDFVLIDSGPGLAGLPAMAMAAADGLLVTVRPGYLDARALRQALLTAERALRPVLGVIANGIGRRTLHQADVLADVRELVGDLLLEQAVPLRVQLADAALSGQPVSTYQPHGEAARAFAALAEEVERRAQAS